MTRRLARSRDRAKRREAVRQGQLHFAPAGDLDETIGTAQHAAEHNKHDLVQREQNLARLARILQCRKVVKQPNALCILAHGRLLDRGDHP